MKHSKFRLIILMSIVISCNSNNNQNSKYYIPPDVRELAIEDKYNYSLWILYVLSTEEYSMFNRYAMLESNDKCFFNNMINKKRDTIIDLFFVSSCNTSIHIPNTFFFKKDTLRFIDLGDNMIVNANAYLHDINFNEKEKTFIKRIIEHKNQLNPWLKAEAQQRGIIE